MNLFFFVVVSTDIDWKRRVPSYRFGEHSKGSLGHVQGGEFIEVFRIH